jgi:hypothetical protein
MQIIECIYITINREAKAPIILDWRMDTADSKMTGHSPAPTTITLEADSLNKTAHGDTTRPGWNVSLASQFTPKSRANTLDKCTRRKPVTRRTDLFMGELKQKLNTNEHPVLDVNC